MFCNSFISSNKLELRAYPEQSDLSRIRFVKEINTSPLLNCQILMMDTYIMIKYFVIQKCIASTGIR